jgi:hypothetical protein
LLFAQLQSALLQEVQLQGAALGLAQLQGASLLNAQLQGAVLHWAQLRGADLSDAQLQGADLQKTGIGGADFENANLDLADLRALDRKLLNKEQYQALSKQLEGAISEPHRWVGRLERLKTAVKTGDTLDKAKSAAQCLSDETPFASCFTKDQLATYHKALAAYLVELACSDSNIARSVARRASYDLYDLPDEDDDEFITALTTLNVDLPTALLKADCEAVKKLPEDIKRASGKL